MKAFKRRGKNYVGVFLPAEAQLITQLGGQVIDLLDERDQHDAAVQRLLPDGYRDDAEAAEEFRRFTADGLVDRKQRNARTMIDGVAGAAAAASATRVELDPAAAQAWIRALTDIRLTIAARLGIEADDQPLPVGEPLAEIYGWLAYVQDSLVEALR